MEKSVDVEPPEIIKSPSFARLFTITRVLKYANVDDSNMIHKLVQTPDISKELREPVKAMLLQLLNDGIKKYMTIYYNKKNTQILLK